jgi:YD repeat-containing protein
MAFIYTYLLSEISDSNHFQMKYNLILRLNIIQGNSTLGDYFSNSKKGRRSLDLFCGLITLQTIVRSVFLSTVTFLFILLTGLSSLNAQNTNQSRFQIFTPNTYELAKYGDVPVDLSTGIPQINIPIMNFSDKDINMDVSLSYHASGIRVDQEASWVGLGWALNTGGVITRVLRGQPDGYHSTYNNTFNTRTSISDYDASSSPSNYFDQVNTLARLAANNVTDNGADIFYYNFNGKAGKFFLDENANATFTKYEDFKVQMVNKNNSYGNIDDSYFVITDEKGIRYEFAAIESTGDLSLNSYISAWYLSKITSPSGGEIKIEYTPGGVTSPSYQKRCYDQAYFPLGFGLPSEYTRHCVNYGAFISPVIPKKITNSSGSSIELITSNVPRLDSEGHTKNQLDYLILYDNNQNQIKKFKFNYSYFEANNNRKFPVEGSNDNRSILNYRLRLDSFQDLSVNNESSSRYRFEYFGDNDPQTDDPYTLPYRLSPSQDHWGYYNGKNNSSIFPSNPSNNPFTQDPWMLALAVSGYTGGPPPTYSIPNGGNREPDSEASKAGSLYKIFYPTGGYTQFTFENHEQSMATQTLSAGGLKVKQIESYDGTGSPKIKNYEYSNTGVSCEKCLSTTNSFYYTWYSQYMDVNTNAPGYPEHMAAFGIPSDLISARHVVKAESSAQRLLGSGMGAFYTTVKESSPGNGYTVYDYSYEADVMDSSGDLLDGLATPGNDFLTWVDTKPEGPINNPFIYRIDKSYCIFPFPYFLNNDWRRGHLLAKSVYSETGKLLSQDSIQYDIRALKAIPGYKVSLITEYIFIYARYYDVGGMVKPIRQVTKTFDTDGNYVRTVKELDYSSTAHKQVTETRDYVGNGEIIFTKYYYPTEYGATLSNLNNRHILNPVDVRGYRNGKLISGEQVEYGNNGLPLTVYRAETGGTGTDIPFNPQTPYTFVPKLSNLYNTDNSLRSQTVIDGSPNIYLWGYKGQYPVAEIKNATYEEVKMALNDASETFINALRNKIEPSGVDLALLNGLRNIPMLSKAAITTYTYRPLVGMTSSTDASGKSTYYYYDSFQRLSTVQDEQGNILKQYCYNYAGNPVACGTTGIPIWQETGQKECVVLNGAYTGEQIKWLVDTNPSSPSYYQSRSVSLGKTGECSGPVTIYARLEPDAEQYYPYGYGWDDYGEYAYSEQRIRFYSDSDCSIPLYLPFNITLNGLRTYTGFNSSQQTYSLSATGAANWDQTSFGNFMTYHYHTYVYDYDYEYFTTDYESNTFELLPGTNYIVR